IVASPDRTRGCRRNIAGPDAAGCSCCSDAPAPGVAGPAIPVHSPDLRPDDCSSVRIVRQPAVSESRGKLPGQANHDSGWTRSSGHPVHDSCRAPTDSKTPDRSAGQSACAHR
nr:hypothetical protein [Tanacetum cinerariifolium]